LLRITVPTVSKEVTRHRTKLAGSAPAIWCGLYVKVMYASQAWLFLISFIGFQIFIFLFPLAPTFRSIGLISPGQENRINGRGYPLR
jgi:hypothetical protein